MKKQRISSTWLALGVGVLVFAGFILVLRCIGLFDFSGSDASAKIVAASLALVGAMITAVVSVFGLLLKNSFDQQAERRAQLEADRNAELKREAEDRLKLEAAIQAVGLLGTSAGELVPMVQRAGVLFSLTSLGRYGLATVLTGELLARDELDAASASGVLHRALLCEEPAVQTEAITILIAHIDRMLAEDGNVQLPLCIVEWEPGLSKYARQWAVIALARLLAARPLKEWNKSALHSLFAALALAWKTEEQDHVRNDAGMVLKTVLPAIPKAGFISKRRRDIHFSEIRDEVSELSSARGAAVKVEIERLEAWVKG